MKIFIVLLLLCVSQTVFAQNTATDSLTRLLSVASSDTAKVNLMNKLCSKLIEVNLDSAFATITRSLSLANKIHYANGEAEAHRMAATVLSFKSNFPEAKTHLQKAEQMFKASGDSLSLSTTHSSYGLWYGLQSKYDSSILYYKKSLSYTERLTDKTQANKTYSNLAISYQMQSDFRNALYYQTKSLKIAEAKNDINALAYDYLNTGITYQNMEDYARAESMELKSVEYAKQAGIKNVELYAYANLSSLYISQNNFDKAYNYAMKAVAIGKTTGDDGITVSCLARAAEALSLQQKFGEAEKLSNEAIFMADSSSQPLNIFQALQPTRHPKKIAETIPGGNHSF